MQRMGSVLGIKPEAIAEYKRIHADIWPEVLAMTAACSIRNRPTAPSCLFALAGGKDAKQITSQDNP